MSIKLMTAVFEATFPASEKLLLLAMADFASDDGKSVYPSQGTLAKKTGLTDRTVRTLTKKLIADNVIRKVGKRKSGVLVYELDPEAISSRIEVPETTSAPDRKPLPVVPETTSYDPLDNRQVEPLPDKPVKPANNVYLLAVAIAEVCSMNLEANKGRLLKEAKTLLTAQPSPTPELIKQHYNGDPKAFWKATDWRGVKGQKPNPAAIRETWGQWATKSPSTPRGRGAYHYGGK